MAKLDLKSAYGMILVHPDDSLLLDVNWRGVSYIDRSLPFGLRSAPIIFSSVADGLSWALCQSGVEFSLHYLDELFFCGPTDSPSCAAALATAVPLCLQLGLLVAPEKLEGPSQSIIFIDIRINSVAMMLLLPEEKLTALKASLALWASRKSATKLQLKELLGLLNHAASVIHPGQTFLRSLIEAMKGVRLPSQKAQLDTQARADIAWWCLFAPN